MNTSDTPIGENGKINGKRARYEEAKVKNVSNESLAEKWEKAGFGNPTFEGVGFDLLPANERRLGGEDNEIIATMSEVLQNANPGSVEVMRTDIFIKAATLGDRNKLEKPEKYDKARAKAKVDSKKRTEVANEKIEEEKKQATGQKGKPEIDRNNR